MQKLIFQPLMKRYSFKSFYLGPLFRAKVIGEDFEWIVTARRSGGFCLHERKTKKVLSRENRVDTEPKQRKEFSLHAFGGRQLGSDITTIFESGGRSHWGETGQVMEMDLQETKRTFECARFVVAHRDFWNKLEVKYDGDLEEAYLGVWWCLHYWFRRSKG